MKEKRKKDRFAAILLSIAYSLKSVIIVTECISDRNETNKHNNCQNLICALNVHLSHEY